MHHLYLIFQIISKQNALFPLTSPRNVYCADKRSEQVNSVYTFPFSFIVQFA